MSDEILGNEQLELFPKDLGEQDEAQQATFENEHDRDYSPMVQISIKEYDRLKEKSNYITDPSLIAIVDKIDELVRALRKHIVRKF